MKKKNEEMEVTSKKNKYCFYFLIFTITLQPCHLCGVSTHISIGQQALQYYKTSSNSSADYASVIRRHQDAFVAGTPYPDGMYSPMCFFGWLHDVAEDTHWVPFLKTSINYIRRKYPHPWNKVCNFLYFRVI